MGLFGPNIDKLEKKRDYTRLADLIPNPKFADEAGKVLVQAGNAAFEPTLRSAQCAFNDLELAVKKADNQTHRKVYVVQAYVILLSRFNNPHCIPFVLKALVYSACVAIPPIETEQEMKKRGDAVLSRLSDPTYNPTFNDVASSLDKALFCNYRACGRLVEKAADILTSFGESAIETLAPLLDDARPPVVYVSKCILERIGTQKAKKLAAEARIQDDPTL